MKYTTKDLYEFVYRADTPEKIKIAQKWLSDHREILSANIYDELMNILSRTRKNIFLIRMEKVMQTQRIGDLEVDVSTGEVLAGA